MSIPTRRVRRLKTALAALAVCGALLTACGGGGQDGTDPLLSVPSYGPEGTALPSGAKVVTTEQMKALLASGAELRWLQSEARLAAVAAEQADADADAATLAAATNADLVALRERALAPAADDLLDLAGGDRSIEIEGPDGVQRFVIHGRGLRQRELAVNARTLGSRGDAVAQYTRFHAALPEAVRGDLPAPDALGTLADDQVQALVDQAAQRVIEQLPNESAPSPAAGASASGARARPLGLQRRLAANQLSGCAHASSLSAFSDFDFALKSAVTPTRNQGNRGTCASFAMAGAIETEVKRAYGRSADLSEQQLYAQAKGVWLPTLADFGDGLVVASVLGKLRSLSYVLRTEEAWKYNPSPDRIETALNVGGGVYQKSCNGYFEACSDTNHQMEISCSYVDAINKWVCAELNPANTGASGVERYALQDWTSLWRPTAALTVEAVRASLVSGQPVVISVDVLKCLQKATRWWKNANGDWEEHPQRTYLSQAECTARDSLGVLGSHAMLAVGWISDADLQARYGSDAPPAEGGYFVVKNSWGCGYGDGGFAYISSQYLRSILHHASAVGSVLGSYPKVSLSYGTTQPVVVSVSNQYKIVQPVTATLKATGNALVKRVSFFAKSGLVWSQVKSVTGSGTFEYAFAIDAGDNGDRSYYVVGYDSEGNAVSSNTVTLRVRIPGAPTVQLSASPADLLEGNPITLSATASSSDGSGIARVEFWEGLTKLGQDTTAPYTLSVPTTRGDAGDHVYTARAVNDNGFAATSATVTVRVRSTAKPSIASFTVTPATLSAPGTVTLNWSVANADSLVLNPGGVVLSGNSRTANVTASTQFTLVASNANGSTSASASVTLVPPPSIGSFSATPTTTAPGGGTVTLAWTASNATTLTIDQGVGDVTGLSSKAVTVNTSRTFTLTAGNASGTVTRQVAVTVPATPPPPPSIAVFAASPASLAYPGGTSVLSWSVSGATSVEIDQGIGDVTGTTSQSVELASTKTFTLKATNAAGASTAQVTVTVAAPPPPPAIASFTASPAALPAGGGASTLSWSVSGATSLSIDQGVGDVSGSSSKVVTVGAGSTTFRLTATNAGGSSSAEVTVTVDAPSPDRYVDPVAGSNANPGSAALPWRTVGHGLANVASGATLWLKNGNYGRAAEGMSINQRLSVPADRILRAETKAGAVLGFGLTFQGAGTVIGLAFDLTDTLAEAVSASGGVVTLRRIQVRNAGCDGTGAVVAGSGSLVIVDAEGEATHEHAGAGVRTFGLVGGDGELRIVGGRISGAGGRDCAGTGVLSGTQSGVLRLDGVTVADSQMGSGGWVNTAILWMLGGSAALLNNSVIDGASVANGQTVQGVFLSSSSRLTMNGGAIRNLPADSPAIGGGGSGGARATVSLSGATLSGNGQGMLLGSVDVTLLSSIVSGNRGGGIEIQSGGSLAILDSTISGNWPAGSSAAAPRASAIAMWAGGDNRFTMAGSTIENNGGGSGSSPAIAFEGGSGSSYVLGPDATRPGNVFSGNANTHLEVAVDSAVTVNAAGNTWTALVQGADAQGRYVVPSALCTASPCVVTSGSGPNFKLRFGALRLTD